MGAKTTQEIETDDTLKAAADKIIKNSRFEYLGKDDSNDQIVVNIGNMNKTEALATLPPNVDILRWSEEGEIAILEPSDQYYS